MEIFTHFCDAYTEVIIQSAKKGVPRVRHLPPLQRFQVLKYQKVQRAPTLGLVPNPFLMYLDGLLLSLFLSELRRTLNITAEGPLTIVIHSIIFKKSHRIGYIIHSTAVTHCHFPPIRG